VQADIVCNLSGLHPLNTTWLARRTHCPELRQRRIYAHSVADITGGPGRRMKKLTPGTGTCPYPHHFPNQTTPACWLTAPRLYRTVRHTDGRQFGCGCIMYATYLNLPAVVATHLHLSFHLLHGFIQCAVHMRCRCDVDTTVSRTWRLYACTTVLDALSLRYRCHMRHLTVTHQRGFKRRGLRHVGCCRLPPALTARPPPSDMHSPLFHYLPRGAPEQRSSAAILARWGLDGITPPRHGTNAYHHHSSVKLPPAPPLRPRARTTCTPSRFLPGSRYRTTRISAHFAVQADWTFVLLCALRTITCLPLHAVYNAFIT